MLCEAYGRVQKRRCVAVARRTFRIGFQSRLQDESEDLALPEGSEG